MVVTKTNNGRAGVGIIGTGMWGNMHAPAVRANPYADIVGLCDIREEASSAL